MFPYKQIRFNKKTMQEHRVIMENHLGRKLKNTELVHHIDGNTKNNDINNLQVMTWKEHGKLHEKKTVFIELKCAYCNCLFKRSKSRYNLLKKKGQNKVYCSRRCQGKNNSKYFPHGKDSKYKKIIDKELSKGLTGYKIAKKHKMCKGTVYNYIRKIAPLRSQVKRAGL